MATPEKATDHARGYANAGTTAASGDQRLAARRLAQMWALVSIAESLEGILNAMERGK